MDGWIHSFVHSFIPVFHSNRGRTRRTGLVRRSFSPSSACIAIRTGIRIGTIRRGIVAIRGIAVCGVAVRGIGGIGAAALLMLISRIPVFPVGPTDRTRLLVGIEPGRDALQVKGVSAGSKDDGRLVPGKLDPRRASLEGRLADPTDFLVAPVPDVPGPSGDSVELLDADPQFRGGVGSGSVGRRRRRIGCNVHGSSSCCIAGGNRCIARSFAGGRR